MTLFFRSLLLFYEHHKYVVRVRVFKYYLPFFFFSVLLLVSLEVSRSQLEVHHFPLAWALALLEVKLSA